MSPLSPTPNPSPTCSLFKQSRRSRRLSAPPAEAISPKIHREELKFGYKSVDPLGLRVEKMDRDWMYNDKRHVMEFRDGVKQFLIAAKEHMEISGKEYMFCPCNDCENKKMWKGSAQIQAHLIQRGFMRHYKIWTEHAEKGVNFSHGVDEEPNDVAVNLTTNDDGDTFDNDVPDEDPDLEQMLRDAEIDFSTREFDKFCQIKEDQEKQLYHGCERYSKLSSVLELLKLKARHRWSDQSFTELLRLLKDVLPDDNAILFPCFFRLLDMGKKKKAAAASRPGVAMEGSNEASKAYEVSRLRRINENIEKMRELGIADSAAGFNIIKDGPQKRKKNAHKEAPRHTNDDEDKDFDPADEEEDGTDEDEDEGQGQGQVSTVEDVPLVLAEPTSKVRPKRGRGRNKMPEGRFTITQVSRAGVPTHPKSSAKLFRTACGVIAKERININTPSWADVEESEGNVFWSDIERKFDIPEQVKDLVKTKTLKAIGASFKQFKHTLTKFYAMKGLSPFHLYPFIDKVDWDNFVESRSSDEFIKSSEEHKVIQSQNTNPHRLGTSGYDGKAEEWSREDEQAIPKIKNPRDKEVSEKMRQLTAESSQGSIQFDREDDMLTKALGRPEHPGRTRGVSVYATWKQGFPNDVGTYRSRKRRADARDTELVEAVRAEMRDRISSLEEKIDRLTQSQQVGLTAFEGDPPQIGSSCASAQNVDIYPVDNIQVPTPCTRQVLVKGDPMDAAKGLAYPCAQGQLMHTSTLISSNNAKVSVEWVEPFCKNVKRKFPPSDEITTLGQAIRSFIQWPKAHITLDPPAAAAPPSPVLPASSAPMPAIKPPLARKHLESPMKHAKTSSKEEKEKGKGKKRNVKGTKGKGIEGPTTYPCMLGLPFGNELFLSSTSYACRNLHQWYMKRSNEEKDLPQNITGFIKDEVLLSGDTYFAISFEDLHLLFQYRELDTGLLTAWTLFMLEEVGPGREKMAFLDPGPISENEITRNMQGAVDYIFKVLVASRSKDYIIGAYNSGANWHWIMVVIDVQHGTVFYLDSKDNASDSMKPITSAIDRAFEMYIQLESAKIPKNGKRKLHHRFHFPCHKQPPGNNHCGFYTCFVMQEIVSSVPPYLEIEGMEEQWNVPSTSLMESDLSRIRGQLCNFIKRQIVEPTGDYHPSATVSPMKQ